MLTAKDVIGWLGQIDVADVLSADTQGSEPGEQIIVDLATPGANVGGEGQFRTANITITILAASSDRLTELETQVEQRVNADATGAGSWPAADTTTRVLYVDFAIPGNGWQRRPIDPSDRHIAAGQFTASLGVNRAA
jgi:hypothetical protein